MYKLLLLIPLLVLLSACTQQTRNITPHADYTSQVAPYSLEALNARYHQGQ